MNIRRSREERFRSIRVAHLDESLGLWTCVCVCVERTSNKRDEIRT